MANIKTSMAGDTKPFPKQTIAVVIPAAGFGKRLGKQTAKQFLTINNKTILAYTVEQFHYWATYYQHTICIMVALSSEAELPDDVDNVQTCLGGKERADSVANALDALAKSEDNIPEWVLVHDAARPLISISDIENLYQALSTDTVGGLLAEKVTATVKQTRLTDNQCIPEVINTIPRQDLWLAQTPQMFKFELLQQAFQQNHSHYTDEASAIESLGLKPKIIEGSRNNIKITNLEDWETVISVLGSKPL